MIQQSTSDYLSKELKAGSPNGICTPMIIVALFTTVKQWKQPKCPLMDEWINKMWYGHTMEYYSALKKKSHHLLQYGWILKTLCQLK